jgi:hypothetical protein
MSEAELLSGTEVAWKYAYSVSGIAKRILHSPAPWPVRLGTNLGYRFYAHRLSQFYNCDWIIPGARHPESKVEMGIPDRLVPSPAAANQ